VYGTSSLANVTFVSQRSRVRVVDSVKERLFAASVMFASVRVVKFEGLLDDALLRVDDADSGSNVTFVPVR